MTDQFVAEIRMFGFEFAPVGWALCNGQLLPLSQNTALFSLLGSTYGGDAKSTFGLPDMQGKAGIHFGQGSGLSERIRGEEGGVEYVTLLQNEMPAHVHQAMASGGFGASNDPTGRVLGRPFGGGLMYAPGPGNSQLAPESLAPAGGSLPHNNMQPYQCVSFCIALQGEYPQRW